MGTRNLTIVAKSGEYRVAQYCQWDGYPSGQGAVILKFLREKMKRPAFDEAVLKIRWITDEDLGAAQTSCGAQDGMFNMTQHDEYKKRFRHLHRDTGADILGIVQAAGGDIALSNSIEFAADSLFCEWAYVIDLDRNTFEIFKGFNKEPLSIMERFSHLEPADRDRRMDLHGEIYYPVKFLREYSLNDLPTEDQFLADFKPPEEEE